MERIEAGDPNVCVIGVANSPKGLAGLLPNVDLRGGIFIDIYGHL